MNLILIKNITYIEVHENKICEEYYFCEKFLWVTEHFISKYDHSYLNMNEHIDEFYVKDKTLYYYPHIIFHFVNGTKMTSFFKDIDKLNEWLNKYNKHIKQFYLEL